MEVELAQTRDTLVDLEMRVEGHEAMLAEKGKYITHLEEKLARATSNSFRLE